MTPDSCQGLSVLIMDDEEDFGQTLAGRLELRGMRVRTALSGHEGLDMFQRERPDVILLDMRMPGLSGVDVLFQVRLLDPELPVLILTGHCSELDFEQAKNLGIQGYHPKPLDFDLLVHSLRDIARKSVQRLS